ncbi:MAG: hypothetical protein ABIG95_01505 [Candidatus Woesearchaeota archaeon]
MLTQRIAVPLFSLSAIDLAVTSIVMFPDFKLNLKGLSELPIYDSGRLAHYGLFEFFPKEPSNILAQYLPDLVGILLEGFQVGFLERIARTGSNFIEDFRGRVKADEVRTLYSGEWKDIEPFALGTVETSNRVHYPTPIRAARVLRQMGKHLGIPYEAIAKALPKPFSRATGEAEIIEAIARKGFVILYRHYSIPRENLEYVFSHDAHPGVSDKKYPFPTLVFRVSIPVFYISPGNAHGFQYSGAIVSINQGNPIISQCRTKAPVWSKITE